MALTDDKSKAGSSGPGARNALPTAWDKPLELLPESLSDDVEESVLSTSVTPTPVSVPKPSSEPKHYLDELSVEVVEAEIDPEPEESIPLEAAAGSKKMKDPEAILEIQNASELLFVPLPEAKIPQPERVSIPEPETPKAETAFVASMCEDLTEPESVETEWGITEAPMNTLDASEVVQTETMALPETMSNIETESESETPFDPLPETPPSIGNETIYVPLYEPKKKTTKPKRSPFDWTYFLSGLIVLSISAVFLVVTLPDMGLTDDDDFYVPAGIDYIKWVKRAVSQSLKGDFSEFKKEKVERGWANNHEHPAVAKLAMGASWLVLHDWTRLMGQVDAARMGVVLFALLLLYLVFRFSWEVFGPAAALFSTFALLLMPRTFFDMHVPTLDIPTTTTVFLVAYAVWRAETKPIFVIFAGIFYGVALCTKLNGPFVVFPLLAYWLYRWRQNKVLGAMSRLPFGRMLATGSSMALLSFPVFWLLWPWIWHDTHRKLLEYFNFHFHHYGIRLLYLGKVYVDPFAPWHAPFVYAGWVIPDLVLLLGLIGFVYGIKQLLPGNLKRFPEGPGSKNDMALFCAVNAFFAIGIVAFPNNPKYGGVKLFEPLFPFFAILAGYAFERLLTNLGMLSTWFKRYRLVLAVMLGLLLLAPGAIGMMRVYPYMLSYFNGLAGGPMGATEAGMERQYYDMMYRPMADFFNDFGGKDAKVAYEPNAVEYRRTFPWYKRDMVLRQDVNIVEPKAARYMVLTHERRWSHYQELLEEYRRNPVVHNARAWNVPLWTVFDLKPDSKPGKK